MAEIMGLNSPVSEGSALDREIRGRVWWSLYLSDMWCMCGQGLHSQLNDVQVKIELPINDETFMSLHSDQVAITGPLEIGIWAQIMTLVPLFGPIHNINLRIATGGPHTIELDQQVEQLAQKLEDWKNDLPPDAQMSQENLHQQQKRGLGGLLISIHLAYHHYSTLLYFRYLEARRPVSSTDRTCMIRCKAHASSFSSLLSLSRQLKGCDVVHPTVGHMATVSSAVLVHTLLFGDLDELESVRQELNANFEALTELAHYWPATSTMIESLVVFQDMCLLSTESTTHKMDGWMLRFLTEQSMDIAAKKMQVNSSSLNAGQEKPSSKAKDLAEQGRYQSFRHPQVLT
ncbi:hypothetical protein LTR10_024319 [Elasticomyces elasticus]|uniref:Xylanolytic transcriptional activator regulatory domain-containing protein n=1 Tax=Exophiala sideris TaxID=1016849 RepID=A0ABR0J6Z4_9EURO|nr:hypothetical protein LTR10_024319 [Elasticomyces elasticus]KAK5028949.1 hypothetical protein LTS07_006331 [Exophiala sideris]KAK5035818.1 hypothetical protein LTR13_005950 [Exophiala sideris]KAK5057453.1 hypothetical protein LTR69_007495 [Exophiala sideris]KAK5181571.1 hypothetical protein LTR44_005769 [Eurotiomycetes sp. CCFEE 6388]